MNPCVGLGVGEVRALLAQGATAETSPRPGSLVVHPLIPAFDTPILHIPLPPGLPWESLPIHGFGLLVAVGFVVGGRVALARARRLGLDPDHVQRVVGWLVVGTILGGHVGAELMYHPAELWSDPSRLLRVWQGLSSFGGFAVCLPLAWWYFRSRRLPFWPYADCLAHGFAIGWFFGRMGCFVTHDHPGPETTFWLGVYGTCPGRAPTVACHDLGLYEGLWSLAVFALFVALDRVPRRAGTYALLLGLLYAPVRFVMDGFRPEVTDARYLGMTPAQYGAALLFVLCAIGVAARRDRAGPSAPPPTA